MYTSYRVKAIIKPAYVRYIQDFCSNRVWSSDGQPSCITEWQMYQDSIGAFKVIDDIKYYHNAIPLGLPSALWGSECIVYEDDTHSNVWWWSFSGEMKNTNAQIEQFLHCVVCRLCRSVQLCWTCNEDDTLFTEHDFKKIQQDSKR